MKEILRHKMFNIQITKMDRAFESQTEKVESINHCENFQQTEVTDKHWFCDRNQSPIPESEHGNGKNLSFWSRFERWHFLESQVVLIKFISGFFCWDNF